RRTSAWINVDALNLNGRKAESISNPDHKWREVHRLMFDEKIGAFALSETHMSPTQVQEIQDDRTYGRRMDIYHSSNPENPSTRGVAIVLNREITNTKGVKVHYLIPGRAIMAVIPWHGRRTLTLLAVYAPAESMEENEEFWDELTNMWMTIDLPVPDCMAGDTNIVEEPADRMPHRRDAAGATAALARFKRILGLEDGWRNFNPDVKDYTYASPHNTLSRIDRIYGSPAILKHSRDWKISDAAGGLSDHRMVSVQIRAPGSPFVGKGRYTIPLFLLRDKEFMNFVITAGSDLEKQILTAPEDANMVQTHFKSYKDDIRDFASVRAKKAVGALAQKKKKLQNEKIELLNNENPRPAPETESDKDDSSDDEREPPDRETRERSRMDTRIRCHTELDRITKFTVRMSKENKPRDTIDFLQRTDTTPARGSKRSDEMAEIARDYHNDLQEDETERTPQAKTDAIQTALDGMSSYRNHPDMKKLAELLTEEDVTEALRQSSNGTASGMNGIPNELWKKLHEIYLEAKRAERNNQEGPDSTAPTMFSVVRVLTLVYNNIQKHGVVAGTQFATGW
ncbi:Endonuclease/exonuclease/phosphatase, partial [Mycena polygramma]